MSTTAGGVEVPNPVVTVCGIVYNPGGTVSKGTAIQLINSYSLSQENEIQTSYSYTTITDNNGTYSSHVDVNQMYTLYMTGDSGVALKKLSNLSQYEIDSLNPKIRLSPDTLREPGSLKGILRLRDGEDPQEVLVISFEFGNNIKVDKYGFFEINDLAEGEYRFRIIPPKKYQYVDTMFFVPRGENITLEDTIILYPNKEDTNVCSGNIKYPHYGDTVQQYIEIMGDVNQVCNDFHLWLLVHEEHINGFFPQLNEFLPMNSYWTSEVKIGADNNISSGKKFTIYLCAADENANTIFQTYINRGNESNEWNAVQWPKGASLLDQIQVVRK